MIYTIVWWICLLFLLALFARMILSYLSIMPGTPLESFNSALVTVTDPVLRPVRRVLPSARFGGTAFDFSPLIVSIAIIIIMSLL
jgi:YggT family protein